ncbi:MAG: adenosylmethionine--8-amino-7-oxononanoate transaminase, partial [Planctomycetota bacterium]|nr:adenosylmethionine--8-amino-7-oxononanoate transaminase [Planctomycetota bacterium]
MNTESLHRWDHEFVWHPFAPMQAFREENAPIIESAEGVHLYDTDGNRYLDGISSLWCNVHGHRVPEIDEAICKQLDRVSHSTLLGLSHPPSIELARELVARVPKGLTKVFYSDSGATAVEVALKMAFQYHCQKKKNAAKRDLFVRLADAYHGDTIGAMSLGGIDLFHKVYGQLLFPTLTLPAPVTYRLPDSHTAESYLQFCDDELERVLRAEHQRIAAFIIEPLVQGAAGILVHPPGYLKRVRELTKELDIPLIADEVAVGFGRTGTLFACEQEHVVPDIMCLAKGLTGGYLPLAATLATDEIYDAFLGEPHEGRTFYHGHTFTGNPLGCAAALASLKLFDEHKLLETIAANGQRLRRNLAPLDEHPHVGEVRRKGIMVGIELVANRETKEPFAPPLRMGHQVTLAARKRGVIIRPLGDVVVLMPAPAMDGDAIDELCAVAIEAIDEAVSHLSQRE